MTENGGKWDALHGVARSFGFKGDIQEAVPFGTGHINDTYRITAELRGQAGRFIFQRINDRVFPNVPGLMENVARVTSHIRGKVADQGGDVHRSALRLLESVTGGHFVQDEQGHSWRVYHFVEGARTYDTLDSVEQAYEAARAFGLFQEQLVDFPLPPLHEVIPGFHDGRKRYAAFESALNSNVVGRAASSAEEIAFLKDHRWVFDVFPNLESQGRMTRRVTHHDTKINNVLLDDDTGKGICVIDLDTVMPGLSLYDFGDLCRTTLSRSAEDERDLDLVYVQKEIFQAVVNGYWSTAGKFLSPIEREHLVFSAKMITLIIGCRFLTDHLAGDVYFKIHRENHNLDRCRTQFKLVKSITDMEKDLQSIVENLD